MNATTKYGDSACPECGGIDATADAGRDRYQRCDAHKVFWYAGSGVFRPRPTEEELTALWRSEGYREVSLLEEDSRKIIHDPQGSPSDDFGDALPF